MNPDKKHIIVKELKSRIYKGALNRGDKLPTQNELAIHYDVSRDTVNKAIKELVAENWIKTSKKGGSIVSDSLPFLNHYAIVCLRDSWSNSSFTQSLLLAAESSCAGFEGRMTPFNLNRNSTIMNKNTPLDDPTEKLQFAGYIIVEHPDGFQNSTFIRDNQIPKACITACEFEDHFDIRIWFDFEALHEMIASKMIIKDFRRPFFLTCPENCFAGGMMKALRDKKIPHSPTHCFSLPFQDAQNTKNVIRIITQMHESVRPDVIVILDDNLLKPVCEELQSLKNSGQSTPLIISHYNHPSPDKLDYPVLKIGFDLRSVFTTCLPLLEKKRLGGKIPKRILIKPKSFS